MKRINNDSRLIIKGKMEKKRLDEQSKTALVCVNEKRMINKLWKGQREKRREEGTGTRCLFATPYGASSDASIPHQSALSV